MRFHRPSVLVTLALGTASLLGGCSGTEADTSAAGGGVAGAPTAGISGSENPAGAGGATGGMVGSTGGGGQAAGGGDGGAASGSGGASDGGNAGRAGDGAGGVAGTAGASGAGGGSAYKPCPTDGTVCKILPFGDSITRGAKSSDDAGYRSALFKLIVAGQKKATFTGSLSNGPTQVAGQDFPRRHEGRPGWTIDPGYNMISSSYGGISSLVPSPALNEAPHIILLMIGTNDLFARDTANMATRLEVLLDKIAENAPQALIVLAQITPLGSASSAVTAYNAKIPGIIEAHAAKGQHMIGVDMSQLPTSDLADGTHPNDGGYAFMANVWYTAVKDLLPNAEQ